MSQIIMAIFLLILGIVLLIISRKRKGLISTLSDIAGVLAFILALSMLVFPRIYPPPEKTPLPIGTEAVNWAASFEHRFPSNYWSIGNHNYTISADCPNYPIEQSGSWTIDFTVSETAELLSGDVVFRISGLKNISSPNVNIQVINPSQTTVAIVTVGDKLNRSTAEFAATDCTANVSWDNQPSVEMKPFLEQR